MVRTQHTRRQRRRVHCNKKYASTKGDKEQIDESCMGGAHCHCSDDEFNSPNSWETCLPSEKFRANDARSKQTRVISERARMSVCLCLHVCLCLKHTPTPIYTGAPLLILRSLLCKQICKLILSQTTSVMVQLENLFLPERFLFRSAV